MKNGSLYQNKTSRTKLQKPNKSKIRITKKNQIIKKEPNKLEIRNQKSEITNLLT